MKKAQIFFLVWIFIFFLVSSANAQSKSSATESHAIALTNPNIILFNANVITMDEQMPSAQAIAIEGNRISAVGTNDVVLALQTGGTQLIDLEGITIVPGLIEAHNHRLLHAFWEDGPEGLVRATQDMAADGFTTVHELYGDPGFISWAQTLAQEGRLAVRIGCYIPFLTNCGDNVEPWMTYPYTEKKDTTLRVIGVKIFADGGSCGYPAITTLYQAGGAQGTHGDLFRTQEEMNSIVETVLNAGFPIAMHAIGDSAIGVGLNAFENAFAGKGNQLRCRMEHLRVMREDLVDKMVALGIGAAIQYTWANSSASRFERLYLPEVLEWVYPWRRMADRGIPIVGSNDAPFTVRTQAMQTISILATRKTRADEVIPGWMAGDQLTVEEGLLAMTMTNAWVAFEENMKGSITPGKLADLTMLSEDPLSMDPFDVRYITIEMTIMDGIIRHNQMDVNHTAIHDAGTFKIGVDDRGLWGPWRSQAGLLYNGIEQLYQGTLLVSYDSSTVATGTFPQQDYVTSPEGWVDFNEPGTVATEEATVTYEDAAVWHPGKLRITQETFMWEDDPLLLIQYTIQNIGENALSDIFIGPLMDFDIGSDLADWINNVGTWESNQGRGFAYMYTTNNPAAPYIGMAMFDSTLQGAASSLTFTRGSMLRESSAEPYFAESMRSGNIQSMTDTPGDYAILLGAGPFSLNDNQSMSPFMLAIVAGENLDDLKNAVNQAYQRSTLVTSVKERPGQVPDVFRLFQNYPNPFNPTTTIKYGIPERSRVKLVIYNILGELVRELVNKEQEVGYYEVELNASSISSGVYFYRLQAAEFVDTKKMVLLK
jgi:predicted amidohydrolase YtcJ